MENTARPTLMSLIPNIFPFSVRYGPLICGSSDCALHKISFHTDCIITGSVQDARWLVLQHGGRRRASR